MANPAPTPADAVPVAVAARLLGLHPERVRQLIRAGYATSPSRGQVALAGLLTGYCRYLKTEAGRPESEAVARGQSAKAELIAAATSRRRSELMPRADAEQALEVVAEVAVRHLRGLTGKRALKGLPADLQTRVGSEVAEACTRIAAAHDAARTALTTGDFGPIEGGHHER